MEAELTEVTDFLARHSPFDVLPRPVLAELPSLMTMRYVRRGTTVLRVGQSNDVVSILRSGAVDILDPTGRLVERGGEGTILGNSNVLAGGLVEYDVLTIEDTLLLDLPGQEFLRLVGEYPEFGRFFVQLLATRLRGAVETVTAAATGGATFRTRVRDMIRRPPVSTTAHATIRAAAELMTAENVSALLITEANGTGRMVGILTDRDIRRRVVAAGHPLDAPVKEVMTAEPVTASVDARAFEVLLDLLEKNVHHLPILDGDRPVGLVTSTDMIRLERGNPLFLASEIARTGDLDGLVAASSRLPAIVDQLVVADATADDIARLVTAVGDALQRRLVELAIADLGPAPAAYCWVVLGSGARGEQALRSDQDHALILADDLPESADRYFAALAERVSAGLEACGYRRCEGAVMATNPRWRQPLSVWRRYFAEWIERPEPDAVLHASIFFDMRPLTGEASLQRELAAYVQSAAPSGTRFLGHLAKMAVAHEPPLGFFRGFVVRDEGEHRDELDLKWGGVGAVVEVARVFGLAVGAREVSTVGRVRAAVAAGKLSEDRGNDLIDAFEFISHVRFRHQAAQVHAGRQPDNFVAPTSLSPFDRRHLRDAFSVVRSTQHLLTQIYPLHYMS